MPLVNEVAYACTNKSVCGKKATLRGNSGSYFPGQERLAHAVT